MRALTEVVDQLAAEQPDGLLVKSGASSDRVLAWSPAAWFQLARTVDNVSHWMEALLGPAAESQTVAYMGISDVRYPIVIVAALNTGYTIYLALPRNRQKMQVYLLESTMCTTFVHTAEFAAQMQAFLTPRQPAIANPLTKASKQNKPSAATLAPLVPEEICNLPSGRKMLSSPNYVLSSGAPLARSCGDQIARVTNLQIHIDNAKILITHSYLAQKPRDREYIECSADADIVMEPATEHSFAMAIQDEHPVRESDGVEAPTGLAGIKGMVKAALRTWLGSSDREYTDYDDISVGGFDSLRALALSNILLSVL